MLKSFRFVLVPLLHLFILNPVAAPLCIFPFYMNGKRYTGCTEDSHCSAHRIYAGELIPCLTAAAPPLLQKVLVRHRSIHVVLCVPADATMNSEPILRNIRVKREPWLRQKHPGLVEVFDAPESDFYEVECYHLQDRKQRTIIKVFRAENSGPPENVTVEEKRMQTGDKLVCGESVSALEVIGITEELSELFVYHGEQDIYQTFDQRYPHTWTVQKFGAGGRWMIGCFILGELYKLFDVTVIGFPSMPTVTPWKPNRITPGLKTPFKCEVKNQMYVISLKISIKRISGPEIFNINGNQMTLRDGVTVNTDQNGSVYRCIAHSGRIVLFEEFEVKVVDRDILQPVINPDVSWLPASQQNFTYNCTLDNNEVSDNLHLSMKGFRISPKVQKLEPRFNRIRSDMIQIGSSDSIEITLQCTLGNGKVVNSVKKIIYIEKIGHLQSIQGLVFSKKDVGVPYKPCVFIAEKDMALPEILIEKIDGPAGFFKISQESIIPVVDGPSPIVTFKCSVTANDGVLIDSARIQTMIFDGIHLSVSPNKLQHHVRMGDKWTIGCTADPPAHFLNHVRALRWHVSCLHRENCQYTLDSSWLVTAPRQFDVQIGTYSAKCSLIQDGNIISQKITVTVHPRITLHLILTSSSTEETYQCSPSSSYLFQYQPFISSYELTGPEPAIHDESIFMVQTRRYRILRTHCCFLNSSILQFQRCFASTTTFPERVKMFNKFSFATPGNKGARMEAQLQTKIGITKRTVCFFLRGQERILATKDAHAFENLYTGRTRCSLYTCEAMISPHLTKKYYGSVCAISESETVEFVHSSPHGHDKIHELWDGKVTCQFANELLRQNIKTHNLKITWVSGNNYSINKNVVELSRKPAGTYFHHRCAFTTKNFTIQKELKLQVIGGHWLFLKGEKYVYSNLKMKCETENRKQVDVLPNPNDTNPIIQARSSSWKILGEDMQSSAFYCQHPIGKDFRIHFNLTVLKNIKPIIFPKFPVMFAQEKLYTMCVTSRPDLEISLSMPLIVPHSSNKDFPGFDSDGRTVATHVELWRTAGPEMELSNISCSLSRKGTKFGSVFHLMLVLNNPIHMKLSGDIPLMNSPKKKDVNCGFSADRPSAFQVRWSIIYDPAKRLSINGSVLEIAPGVNQGKALARCYLLYGNHMTTSIDYHLLILPTGVRPEPQITPERSFLWLDESVSFKLQLKVDHLSRSIQKRLQSSLTIMVHISGRRSHGLKGNVLYPVTLHQPSAENWTSFQIHYDLFYSSYRFKLRKRLE
ncbi:hypothetical protein CSKR_111451, partial [Clonorchis sinensis]